jgi:tetratricopeptide (TPR) repeat protein
VFVLALLGAAAFPAFAAASSASAASGFELTRGSQRALYRLQESWLQWVSALYRDNQAKADQALATIEANARQVGMTRLVDFSLGAVAMAREAAANGNFARAGWALAAAEKLDPGRAETAFGRAAVERRRGALLASLRATVSGFARLVRGPESRILFADLRFWLIAVALVASALFVLVEVATKGSAVVQDLRRWLSKRLSSATIWLVATVLLLWPLVLPGGPLWLLLYWSALLWGYQSRSARWVTVGVWVVISFAPLFAARALERVALELSPPMRAVSHFAEGRLYGGLFADLEVLRGAIGDRPAAQQLLADVHRTLGQWEEARQLYRRVLEAEPENVAALIDLGAYQFRKSDFALANEYFRQAAGHSGSSAGALYNLSLSFSETYQFDESRQALAQARDVDAARVDQWVKSPHAERVLTFNGGLGRIDEIERELISAWAAAPAGGEKPSRASATPNLVALLIVAGLGVGLVVLRRGSGYSEPSPWLGWRAGPVGRWLRAFLPALSQAELGEGPRALGSLAAVAAILLAPMLFTLGVDVPILSGLPQAVPWTLCVLGAAAYLGLCVRAELREGR